MAGGYYRFDLERGFGSEQPGTYWAHVRLRGPAPAPCVMPDFAEPGERCRRMSVALCDWPVSPSGRTTCSAPICERHRTHVGADRDYCPRHAKQERLPLEDVTT